MILKISDEEIENDINNCIESMIPDEIKEIIKFLDENEDL